MRIKEIIWLTQSDGASAPVMRLRAVTSPPVAIGGKYV